MQPLPPDFLRTIARQYDLSPEQEDALVVSFHDAENERDAVEALHITTSALRSRMTEIYRKFRIGGKGPGKFYKLQDLLRQKYLIEKPAGSPAPELAGDIDALVQEFRQRVHDDIQERCGTMRVLDMAQPIGLADIYTNVLILEKIIGRRRLEIGDLLRDVDLENFDRLELGSTCQERVPGLAAVEQYSKLMVLGKPGVGKTTFLKRLAILCNSGEFQADRIPIFITLKDFAEAQEQPSLLTYIAWQWSSGGIQDTAVVGTLLSQGRALVMLDGLDEVREVEHNRVLQEIRAFTTQFRTCQFVMTCRIAALEYTFEQFTEVEVADFNDAQIAEFACKWFSARQDPVKAETFIQKLKYSQPIQELATNPLLLTLLCLVYGEAADFPRNRSELYEEGLDVLLSKWDAKRNIERAQVYRKLSLLRKKDLLSQIAFQTFTNCEYFFRERDIEQQIADYSYNLPGASTEPEERKLDSEAVLRSIEVQHSLLVERARGIYSFSHLTFQEYFTAVNIANNSSPKELGALKSLVSHITEKRWENIFLLTTEMLRSADALLKLMKGKIDALLQDDQILQEFLTWVEKKSHLIENAHKPAAVRAFYIGLILNRGLALGHRINDSFNQGLAFHQNLDLTIERDWQFSNQQLKQLQKYYDATQLLVDCINSDIYVTRSVREEIEATLLLPIIM